MSLPFKLGSLNTGSKIPRKGPEAVAFLSCLFPERRADRVYGLQERRLEGILKGGLGLGATGMKELLRWRDEDGPDAFRRPVGDA